MPTPNSNMDRDELVAFTIIVVTFFLIVGYLIDRDHVRDLASIGPLVFSALALIASYVRIRTHKRSNLDSDDPPEGGVSLMALINYSPARIAKAIMAAFGAAAAAYTEAISDNSITTAEWEKIVGAFVIAGILVWLIPNKKPVESKDSAPSA